MFRVYNWNVPLCTIYIINSPSGQSLPAVSIIIHIVFINDSRHIDLLRCRPRPRSMTAKYKTRLRSTYNNNNDHVIALTHDELIATGLFPASRPITNSVSPPSDHDFIYEDCDWSRSWKHYSAVTYVTYYFIHYIFMQTVTAVSTSDAENSLNRLVVTIIRYIYIYGLGHRNALRNFIWKFSIRHYTRWRVTLGMRLPSMTSHPRSRLHGPLTVSTTCVSRLQISTELLVPSRSLDAILKNFLHMGSMCFVVCMILIS